MHTVQHIPIADYSYELPEDRIAQYPLSQRDASRLLIYENNAIREARFQELSSFIPENSLLVFNNTRVIQARLVFKKTTGAQVEIFCLEPDEPADYQLIFQQRKQCSWKCLVGNSKKWKEGVLEQELYLNGETIVLTAERKTSYADSYQITFTWDRPLPFADILEAAGVLPIPPYLNRETESSDTETYQTVYAQIKGSVAAPTAGLHFTPLVLADLDAKGLRRAEVTLHVGAGTFKPVQSETIGGHPMHMEYFSVRKETIEQIQNHTGKVIAVGTTSVRTLESLYYIGVSLSKKEIPPTHEFTVKQWEPYEESTLDIPMKEAFQHILDYLEKHQMNELIGATQIMIVPGYTFRVVQGIVTNFHQPKSTLLLLVSAFVKGNWKSIYDYALAHDFRFLSYGDSSLLL